MNFSQPNVVNSQPVDIETKAEILRSRLTGIGNVIADHINTLETKVNSLSSLPRESETQQMEKENVGADFTSAMSYAISYLETQAAKFSIILSHFSKII